VLLRGSVQKELDVHFYGSGFASPVDLFLTAPIGAQALRRAISPLAVGEVAKLLSVPDATVYTLCARGILAHVRILNAIGVAPTAPNALLMRSAEAL
jgi:hypothetical protein